MTVGLANSLGVGAVECRANETEVVVDVAYFFNNPGYLFLVFTQAHLKDLINRFVHLQTVHQEDTGPGASQSGEREGLSTTVIDLRKRKVRF